MSYALVLLAALELAVWVWLRRDGAFRAIIPTDAPFWLDRGVMAATGVVAVLVAVGAAVAMFRLPDRREPSGGEDAAVPVGRRAERTGSSRRPTDPRRRGQRADRSTPGRLADQSACAGVRAA